MPGMLLSKHLSITTMMHILNAKCRVFGNERISKELRQVGKCIKLCGAKLELSCYYQLKRRVDNLQNLYSFGTKSAYDNESSKVYDLIQEFEKTKVLELALPHMHNLLRILRTITIDLQKTIHGMNKQTRKMEKSFRIIYTLLLCLLAVSANAQKNKKDKDEVKISAAKYDKFRDDIKLLSDSTKTLADSCTSLNSIIQNLQKEKEYLDDVIRNNKRI